MSSTSIQLNFINQSQDPNNSNVVIFQKNEVLATEPIIVWRVLHDTLEGESYAVTYSAGLYVSASDVNGNYSGMVEAQALHTVVDNGFGLEIGIEDEIGSSGNAGLHVGNQIEVVNGLKLGEITVNVYRDGLLLAQRPVVPGQSAKFEFKSTIWIGLVNQVEEGDILNSAITNSIITQISLEGIVSANLIMRGGGPTGPLTFSLTDIVKAV